VEVKGDLQVLTSAGGGGKKKGMERFGEGFGLVGEWQDNWCDDL
jgi:hypothetical protein